MPKDDTYNRSTIYYSVMQKSTGKFLPNVKTRGGYTHTEPQPFDLMPPRLHMHAGSARRARDMYCKGEHMREVVRGGEYGEEAWTTVELKEGTARDKKDFAVQRIRLVIEEEETKLSDGRQWGLENKLAHQVSPWADPHDENDNKDPG